MSGFNTSGGIFVKQVTVTVTAGNTTGSAAHGLGRVPKIMGRPNPNQNDGWNSRASVDATNVTITCAEPVSTNTNFTVDLR